MVLLLAGRSPPACFLLYEGVPPSCSPLLVQQLFGALTVILLNMSRTLTCALLMFRRYDMS